MKSKGIKTILWGVLWTSVVVWISTGTARSRVRDWRILHANEIASGIVTDTWEDVVDSDSEGQYSVHGVAYRFLSADGQEFLGGTGEVRGELGFSEGDSAEVQYDPAAPQFSRLKGYGSQSLLRWWLNTLVRCALFVVFVSPGIWLLRAGVSEWNGSPVPRGTGTNDDEEVP